jgi:predicted aspartyl protease
VAKSYLAFAIILAAIWSPAGAQECGLRQFASVDLMSNERPVVEAQVGGRTVHLLIDTGGVYSTIRKDIADALGLRAHDISSGMAMYSVSGTRLKTYAEMPDFKLGGIALDKYPMLLRPVNGDGGIDGTLAPDFLSRFEVDLDFAGHKLNLFAVDHCPGKVVYWAKSYVEIPFKLDGVTHISVPVTLDGHEIVTTLDTGSGATLIYEGAARSLFDLSTSSAGMERVPSADDGDLVQYRYRFKALSLEGVAVNNPLVYILPDAATRSFRRDFDAKMDNDAIYGRKLDEPQLILGANVLSKLHLFISYKEKKLYLTAADAH